MLGRWLAQLVEAQEFWARPWGDFITRWLRAIYGPMPAVKGWLNGKWLGHSLHAALTDAPIGVLTLAIIFDLIDARPAADFTLAFGILTMVGAAVAGTADYADTDDDARTTASVHATLMVIALLIYLVSLALRLVSPAADRTLPIIVGVLGYGVLVLGAWVGGQVVYAFGNMVNRHAWRFYGAPKWQALDRTEFPEAEPTKAKAGTQSVVVVRMGDALHVLHDQCAHAGGPLSEGRIVDGCIECPWHSSRYELATGRRRRGPTTFDQPTYEVRAAESGGWEVRRRAR
jgi:nitrite reductase/ring-hydroxylating ferredoxin subunit/uncharacterized membrane protein